MLPEQTPTLGILCTPPHPKLFFSEMDEVTLRCAGAICCREF